MNCYIFCDNKLSNIQYFKTPSQMAQFGLLKNELNKKQTRETTISCPGKQQLKSR